MDASAIERLGAERRHLHAVNGKSRAYGSGVRTAIRNGVASTRAGALWLGIMLAIANNAAIPNDAEPASSQSRIISGYAGVSSARDHAHSLRVLTGYAADPAECGDVQLGPLPLGNYTGEEAWLTLIASVCDLVTRRDERTGEMQVFANMSRCQCSFGFPRLKLGQQAHVVVTRSPLPTLEDHVPGATVVMDRTQIEQTGAISVAELLRYVSPTTFHRGTGFRASGAQYAELRGLGTAYTLVLLNGRRTWGTVADVQSNAFDLSAIPSSAVERIEISADTNSLSEGMDAIGGIVNIVLKERVEDTAALRYVLTRARRPNALVDIVPAWYGRASGAAEPLVAGLEMLGLGHR